jgi:hypothetical protein
MTEYFACYLVMYTFSHSIGDIQVSNFQEYDVACQDCQMYASTIKQQHMMQILEGNKEVFCETRRER